MPDYPQKENTQGMAIDRYYTMPPAKINPIVKKRAQNLAPLLHIQFLRRYQIGINLGSS